MFRKLFPKKLNIDLQSMPLTNLLNKCSSHDWVHVQNMAVPRLTNLKVEQYPGVLAYCPRCKSTNRFTTFEWETINKIKEIDSEYAKKASRHA